jgi:hypothetical protein
MFDFVKEYIDGDMERIFFDMDFSYYLFKYYPAMERQNAEMAECCNRRRPMAANRRNGMSRNSREECPGIEGARYWGRTAGVSKV